MHARQHIRDYVRRRHWLLATVIALAIVALPNGSSFADISPLSRDTSGGPTHASGIQLAAANIPSGVGGIDDYMHQQGDGPSTSAPPSQAYSPQSYPPQNYYPQSAPSQDWNYGYADPNAQRSALIGAAVVGAIAVGLWAWQQHEAQQNRPNVPARSRRHHRRPAIE